MNNSQEIRSRGGCLTCKTRKKKCDELKPICFRCQQGGYECLGYGAPRRRKKCSPLPPSTQTSAVVAIPSGNYEFPLKDGQTMCSNSFLNQSTLHQMVEDEPWQNASLDLSRSVHTKGSQNALGIEIKGCKIFANEFWNNLIDIYSAWHALVVSEIPGGPAFIVEIMRTKAARSLVLRNGVLSHAALLLSWTSEPTCDSWKNQALLFNSSAEKLLDEELRHPNVSSSRKFTSLLEVLMFELAARSCRAESTQRLLKEGASLLSTSNNLGIVDLSEYTSLNHKSGEVTLYVFADIISSIFLCRPTLLHYESTPPKTQPREMPATDRVISCSSRIMTCLSRISHLRPLALADHLESQSLSEATLSAARQIEHEIRSYQVQYPNTLSREALVLLSGQECWRFAALIQLYQAIHLVGPLHPVMVNSLQQIIASSRFVPPKCAADRGLATPYFLAGSVAISQKDRAYLRERLSKFDWLPVPGCIRTLEHVWARSDQTGQPIHWSVVAEGAVSTVSA